MGEVLYFSFVIYFWSTKMFDFETFTETSEMFVEFLMK